MKKLVFLTDEPPFRERSGAQIRDASFLRLLAEKFELCVLCASGEAAEAPAHVRVVHARPAGSLRVARLLSPFRAYVRNGYQSSVERALREEWTPGATLWISRLAYAKYLPVARKIGYHAVLDEHNVESDLLMNLLAGRRGCWLERWRARELARWEAAYCKMADAVVVTSDKDAGLIRELSGREAHVIPSYTNVDRFPAPRPKREILFTGTLDYEPNRQALLWFLREVFPRCGERLRELGWGFRVVGSRAGEELKTALSAAGIELSENVPDVAPYLAEAGLVFVPLLHGSGTRLKIVEAFAARRPVLSTTKGAEGIPGLVEGENICLADSSAAFADGLTRLAENDLLRERIAERAGSLAREKFDWRAGRGPLDRVFSDFG